MSAEPITTVERPCEACAHAEVCGIRPDIAQWRIELPTTHSAITARAVVTLDCRHFLPLQVLPAPETMATKVFALTPAGVRMAEELELALGPELAPEPVAPEQPARRGGSRNRAISEETRERLRESGRKGGKNRPTYDRESLFEALRRTRTFAEAGAIVGETAYIVGKRVRTLRSRNELPADLAERQWHASGGTDWDRAETIEAVRANPSLRTAATALRITSSSLLNRLDVMSAEGSLPDDIARRRRSQRAASRAVEPATAPEASPAAQAVAVAAAPKPRARKPEPPAAPVVPVPAPEIPKRVVELPTPEWPAPLPASAAAAVHDDFAERRAQAAREAADRSWRERHPEGVAG